MQVPNFIQKHVDSLNAKRAELESQIADFYDAISQAESDLKNLRVSFDEDVERIRSIYNNALSLKVAYAKEGDKVKDEPIDEDPIIVEEPVKEEPAEEPKEEPADEAPADEAKVIDEEPTKE